MLNAVYLVLDAIVPAVAIAGLVPLILDRKNAFLALSVFVSVLAIMSWHSLSDTLDHKAHLAHVEQRIADMLVGGPSTQEQLEAHLFDQDRGYVGEALYQMDYGNSILPSNISALINDALTHNENVTETIRVYTLVSVGQ
jgi:hypothetical protein